MLINHEIHELHERGTGLLFREESYALIGACFEVYREKGNGFVEAVYQECLELELGFRSIPHASQSALRLSYKGVELKQRYIPDFLCYGKILLELKAAKHLADEHRAQVLNYLKATGL